MMLEWIVSSSVLILVILVLRQVLWGRISMRLQYGLWVLVLLRLLTPLSFFNTGFSVQNITAPVEDAASLDIPKQSFDDAYGQVVREYEENGIDVDSLTGSELEALDYEAMDRMRSGVTVGDLVENLVMPVWIVGTGLFLLVTLGCNLHFYAQLLWSRTHLPVPESSVPVYVSDSVRTPCLFGLFHPAIYVTPAVAGDERKLHHVLQHELTHYAHGDYIIAPLRCIALALHWYNPLVWLAAKVSRQDGELACDEGTVARLGVEERLDYGRTLIQLTCEQAYMTDVMLTATTMTGSGKSIKERIRRIAEQPKMAACTLIAVVLICALAVGCTFTGPVTDTEETTQAIPETSETEMTEETAQSIIDPWEVELTRENVQEKMAELNAEDIVERWFSGSEIPAEELAAAINGAAYQVVDYSAHSYSFWTVDLFLKDDPDGISSDSEHFHLEAMMKENVVYVRYRDGDESTVDFYVEDGTLYWLIRSANRREGTIDKAAFENYRDIIGEKAREMAEVYAQTPDAAPFTGWEITDFVLKDSFKRDGIRYDVYEWDVAYLTEDPYGVVWAGGMSLDSDLRVRGLATETRFAVRTVKSEKEEYRFLGWELFSADAAEQEIWDYYRDTVVKCFNEQ